MCEFITQSEVVDIQQLEQLKTLFSEEGIYLATQAEKDRGEGNVMHVQRVKNLMSEIASGEAVLKRKEDGTLMRELRLVAAICWRYTPFQDRDGNRRVEFLRESSQHRPSISTDLGQFKTRKFHDTSVSGGVLKEDTPEKALKRELKEEMGVNLDEFDVEPLFLGNRSEDKPSKSYPNLSCRYLYTIYGLDISIIFPYKTSVGTIIGPAEYERASSQTSTFEFVDIEGWPGLKKLLEEFDFGL